MLKNSFAPLIVLSLIFVTNRCSDNTSPHKVLLSKVTDNYGAVIELAYNNSNQIISIKKTYSAKVEITNLTYKGDSVLLDAGGKVTVIKYKNGIPLREYSFFKTKPDSAYEIKKFRYKENVLSAFTFISKDPLGADSTIESFTWSA